MRATTALAKRRRAPASTSQWTEREEISALREVQALARSTVSRQVRVANAAKASPARALRSDAPVQRPLRFLRLLEDARRSARARTQVIRRCGATLQSHARHVHGRG